jgi:hypothetical protein
MSPFLTENVVDDSGRISNGGELLFPPFTELGWDQHAPDLLSVDPKQIATFDHVGSFGRPL